MHIFLSVGIYRSKSEADNARHRLVSEGVERKDIIERLTGYEGDSGDPLTADIERRYHLIPPGEETLVAVRTLTLEQADAVESILMMFEPKTMERHDIVAGRLAAPA
ncbi:MAG: hypothetical protein AB7O56_11080 [Bauldia sp.]